LERDQQRRLFRGIFLVALATILFEISLTRVLSFTIWYHFAYVAISTALLGYGASGSLLAARPGIGTRDLAGTLAWCSVGAALSVAVTLGIISSIPLDPMEITTSNRQAFVFVLYQIAVTVPFFFSGLAISLSLRAATASVDRLYFWDLVGAGLGACIAVALMNAVTPPGAALIAAAVFAAAGLAFGPPPDRRGWMAALLIALALAASLGGRIPFTPADSKHLMMHVKRQQMTPVFSHWTALFRTDVVVRDPELTPVSAKDEWGISAVAPGNIQPYWGFVTHDATAGTPVYDLREGRLDFLDHHTLRMPYLVVPSAPRVLVIGVGGGRDIITADRYGASHVTGVELDPVTVELVHDDPFGVSEGLFQSDRVDLIAGEGRSFVRRTEERFDLIQITGVDTLAAQSSGAYVLAENYLYTVEAFSDYLDRLTPDGMLCVTTGHLYDNEPNATGRMVSVAREALLRRGIEQPGRHIAVVTSRRLFANVMVRPTPFTAAQTAALAAEAKRLQFAVLWLPGMPSNAVFTGLATATGAERERLLAEAKYVLTPTTDDSPFFFRLFRWSELDIDPISPVHTTALGQIVLALLLISLTVLSVLLILAPLLVFRRRGIQLGSARPFGILVYFLAIGTGFMLFEISLMQRFVLFLGYPTYSLSVTLASLLVFLGMGSWLSRRWIGRERVVLPLGVVGIAILALFYMRGLPAIQDATLGAPLMARVALTVAVLAPLGLLLGMFFPLGIRFAAAEHEDLVAWAWGINGCASVTGTVLTVMLAMSFGFTRVWLLSLLVYAAGVAALLVTRTIRPPTQAST
jgi:spermidine synthase